MFRLESYLGPLWDKPESGSQHRALSFEPWASLFHKWPFSRSFLCSLPARIRFLLLLARMRVVHRALDGESEHLSSNLSLAMLTRESLLNSGTRSHLYMGTLIPDWCPRIAKRANEILHECICPLRRRPPIQVELRSLGSCSNSEHLLLARTSKDRAIARTYVFVHCYRLWNNLSGPRSGGRAVGVRLSQGLQPGWVTSHAGTFQKLLNKHESFGGEKARNGYF